MADIDTTVRSAQGKSRRCADPVPIGAILPGVCTAIQARCQRAMRRLRTQRQKLRPATRLAG
jgi:hypothetical protein